MGRFTASETQLTGDPKYGSVLASKFINCLMWDGKKAVAQSVFYQALDEVHKRIPDIEVRSRRVGGASYQVPMQVNRKRQQSLALRWIITACRDKKGRPMHEKLANELVAAYNREGAAMTRRENVHRMAEANKAFAHFAW
jgi:small subunit ribosomal protein S7